jgi:hypothetical protein
MKLKYFLLILSMIAGYMPLNSASAPKPVVTGDEPEKPAIPAMSEFYGKYYKAADKINSDRFEEDCKRIIKHTKPDPTEGQPYKTNLGEINYLTLLFLPSSCARLVENFYVTINKEDYPAMFKLIMTSISILKKRAHKRYTLYKKHKSQEDADFNFCCGYSRLPSCVHIRLSKLDENLRGQCHISGQMENRNLFINIQYSSEKLFRHEIKRYLMDYLVTEGLSENDGCGGGDIYGD